MALRIMLVQIILFYHPQNQDLKQKWRPFSYEWDRQYGELQNMTFGANKCYSRINLPLFQNQCMVWLDCKFHSWSLFIYLLRIYGQQPLQRIRLLHIPAIHKRYMRIFQYFVVPKLQRRQCFQKHISYKKSPTLIFRALQLFLFSFQMIEQ